MRYLLDSNVIIDLLRSKPDARVLARLKAIDEEGVFVCSIVRLEVTVGALKSDRPEYHLARVNDLLDNFASYPISNAIADTAARIRASREAAGTPIGPNDLLIAAVALTKGLTLVTHDLADFSGIPGLIIEDWKQSS